MTNWTNFMLKDVFSTHLKIQHGLVWNLDLCCSIYFPFLFPFNLVIKIVFPQSLCSHSSFLKCTPSGMLNAAWSFGKNGL